MYVCMYWCIYVCMYVYVCTYMYVCICMYVCMYVRTYVRLYTHTHTSFKIGFISEDPIKRNFLCNRFLFEKIKTVHSLWSRNPWNKRRTRYLNDKSAEENGLRKADIGQFKLSKWPPDKMKKTSKKINTAWPSSEASVEALFRWYITGYDISCDRSYMLQWLIA